MSEMIELLAPAGSPEGVRAAVQSGAGAVYMGFGTFNARRNAQGFSPDEMAQAIAYCRARGVKTNITLNILAGDRELDDAMRDAKFLYEAGADALIVLGCGVRGERVSLTLARRLDAALSYLEENPQTIVVVSGGQGPGEDIPEAEAMRRYLVARGIEESRILLEARSMSTMENFQFSKALIDSAIGPDATIVFVTTRFHVFRSERIASTLGIQAEGIGADGVAWLEPNNYLRETCAIVYYWLTGRI